MNSAAAQIAGKLLQINAIKLNTKSPFTWASGWKSPVYCDNRKSLAYPYVRDLIKAELCAAIFEKFPEADSIAGVATAGISWGVMAADQLKLPFMYVRPKPKEHGTGSQIEGDFKPGEKVVVVEDLISTGNSSLRVCEVLKNAGLEVSGMVSIFTYGFPQADKAFDDAGIKLYSLSNFETLIGLSSAKQKFSEEDFNSLLNWRSDPASYGK